MVLNNAEVCVLYSLVRKKKPKDLQKFLVIMTSNVCTSLEFKLLVKCRVYVLRRFTSHKWYCYRFRTKSLTYNTNGKDLESGYGVASCIEPLKKHLLHKSAPKLMDKIQQNGKTKDVNHHHNGDIVIANNHNIPVKNNGFY